jgi:hypothetical protein
VVIIGYGSGRYRVSFQLLVMQIDQPAGNGWTALAAFAA